MQSGIEVDKLLSARRRRGGAVLVAALVVLCFGCRCRRCCC